MTSINYAVNPVDQSNDQERSAKIASIGIGIAIGVATMPLGPVSGLVVGTLAGIVAEELFDYIGESTDGLDTDANGGTDYYTRVIWDYPNWPIPISKLINQAVGVNDLTWIFKAGYGDYRLKVSGKVYWDSGSTYINDYIDV